jgi:hypothetical protein
MWVRVSAARGEAESENHGAHVVSV